MKLLLVGATGLVGGEVLKLALADARVSEVVVLSRRALSITHPTLRVHEVDFDHLPDLADIWQADGVICTLGTTMKKAGSKDAFQKVDYEYPLAVACKAYEYGTPAYALNSASMANSQSRLFYNRVKGALERDLQHIGFDSLSLVRPGLIGGQRNEFRLGERCLAWVLTLLAPVLPRAWRINPASRIAQALLDGAVRQPKGITVVSSDQLV